jgi:hypothetical protein
MFWQCLCAVISNGAREAEKKVSLELLAKLFLEKPPKI